MAKRKLQTDMEKVVNKLYEIKSHYNLGDDFMQLKKAIRLLTDIKTSEIVKDAMGEKNG